MCTDDDLSGQVLDSKYHLERMLGAGGFGAVYEATHLLGKATRAVKVLHTRYLDDPVASRQFLKEAQAVMRIETPRAVVVHDVDRDPTGRLFIVMEMLRGETLRKYLAREALPGRGLPVGEAVRIATQVCEALRAAHARGVVHRDLKPSNVMMVPGESDRPDVKVVDFGIARLHSLTQTGETSTEFWTGPIGTPAYMSPEQCRGLDVDGRSDLYSLGVMLYEMLAGRVPFRSNTQQGFAVAHLTETPLPLATACPDAQVPPELDRLVLRLLAKKPEDRPADADEVLRALRAFDPSAPAPARVLPRPDTAPRRRRLPAFAVATGLLVAAGAGGFAWWSSRTPEPVEPPAAPPPAVSGARDILDAVAVPVALPAPAPDPGGAAPDIPRASAEPPPRPPPPRTTRPAASRPKPSPRPAPVEVDRPPAPEKPSPPPTASPRPATKRTAPPSDRDRAASPPPPARERPAATPRTSGDRWDSAFDELERETKKHGR